ncbi:two-component system response regulator [Amycolatopsis mediterranei S699]|uniref:Two-component system response regulator n=3 Tax=Amycolatopsis mediterranei TaxID=33910 RepID=A0A0H3DFX1_AMYMU|nr:response regulator transcription factor [Amycolatopsis mediterranei]ADJ49596.1 two-component system response regulator [Amycolatopsis mediterranei U32]AEK46576.1 two-component system response regulator [Amycolatopsis mediterranei S699]AFO81305.1 two-component system response regulator [Amycolatopsis mediterranei S699]AGT88433.1 two-component system response regulator [Amycolatopsis mediterranei RB]KDO12772.1 LuxR family transcriptional regulator [Amycolatopsis mediterranei]
MIRVLLVDDQRLVRAGFRSILDGEDDITVVAEAADGREALQAAHDHHPDVVLMDIRMPELDGLAATRHLLEDPGVSTRVVILTTFDLDEDVYGALRAGASGFLVKDTEPEELIHAVRVVARGDALLAPSITRRLIAEFAARGTRPAASPALDRLTDREREVLSLVAAGLSNDEIARELTLSPATAKTHVSRIMTKTGTHDRAQLVVLAYESGAVTPRWLAP